MVHAAWAGPGANGDAAVRPPGGGRCGNSQPPPWRRQAFRLACRSSMPVQAGGLKGAGMARSEPARSRCPARRSPGRSICRMGRGRTRPMVMLQGSGVADRESGGFFPPIRSAFLDAGVGVLSWDKPGVGESSGDWRERTLFDSADEALAAIDWLREHPAVDAGRVGITGSASASRSSLSTAI